VKPAGSAGNASSSGVLSGMLESKVDVVGTSDARSQKEVDQMSQEVAHHLELYSAAHRLSREHVCYNSLCKPNSSTPNCFSPMCMHRYRLRKDLLMTLCKAKAMGIDINSKIGAQALSQQQNRSGHLKKHDLLPKPEERKIEEKPEEESKIEDKIDKMKTEEKKKEEQKVVEKLEVTTHVTRSATLTTTTTTSTTISEITNITAKINPADGVLKAALKNPDGLKSRHHLLRPSEPVDTQRIYSAETPKGKLYLKKIVRAINTTTSSVTTSALSTVLSGQVGRRRKLAIKYPVCSRFATYSKKNTILMLPQHELRKLSRKGGSYYVFGFNHGAKVRLINYTLELEYNYVLNVGYYYYYCIIWFSILKSTLK
jgi:nucleosome-remodeling factor subunit BPTF